MKVMDHYASTRPGDRRSPGLEPLPSGTQARVCPERERALSSAMERGAVTVVVVAILLTGGLVFGREVLANAPRIVASLGVVH
jgi:hypothetical protein